MTFIVMRFAYEIEKNRKKDLKTITPKGVD